MTNNTVIQIGCSDGDDHVFQFLKSSKKTYKVVLVDAFLPALKVAKERYKDLNKHNIKFLNKAVLDNEDEFVDFFYTDDGQIHGSSSIFEKFLIDHGVNKDLIKKERVEAININALLKENTNSKIEYLFIDAESLDCSLINNLKLEQFDISNIIFEWAHSEGARTGRNTDTFRETRDKLEKAGYNLHKHESDAWNIIASKD
jgi:FkbM family methyltransferase